MATRPDENAPERDDEFARESFTFRRMKLWQMWALAIAVVVILIAIFAWM